MLVDPDQCVGCLLCETACSDYHEERLQPSESRVRVVSWDLTDVDVPVLCVHCTDPPCAEACPVDAFYRSRETGAVMIDYGKCIGCRICVTACPLGGIFIDPETLSVIKCDACDGKPECVEICPTDALEYVKADGLPPIKRREHAERIPAQMGEDYLEGASSG